MRIYIKIDINRQVSLMVMSLMVILEERRGSNVSLPQP